MNASYQIPWQNFRTTVLFYGREPILFTVLSILVQTHTIITLTYQQASLWFPSSIRRETIILYSLDSNPTIVIDLGHRENCRAEHTHTAKKSLVSFRRYHISNVPSHTRQRIDLDYDIIKPHVFIFFFLSLHCFCFPVGYHQRKQDFCWNIKYYKIYDLIIIYNIIYNMMIIFLLEYKIWYLFWSVILHKDICHIFIKLKIMVSFEYSL